MLGPSVTGMDVIVGLGVCLRVGTGVAAITAFLVGLAVLGVKGALVGLDVGLREGGAVRKTGASVGLMIFMGALTGERVGS